MKYLTKNKYLNLFYLSSGILVSAYFFNIALDKSDKETWEKIANLYNKK